MHRVPQPRSRPASLFPPNRRSHVRSASLPSQLHTLPSHTSIPRPALDPLSVEELALLPICALPAHRAVRTFSDLIAPPGKGSSKSDEKSPPRILVLQGHDSVGAMAVQMLSRRGAKVSVQVPTSAVHTPDEDTSALSDEEFYVIPNGSPDKQPESSQPRQSLRERVEARLRSWGAEVILVGQPLEVIQQLVEERESYDAILDTVGGEDIWQAGQKLLLTTPVSNEDPFTPIPRRPTSPIAVTPGTRRGSSIDGRPSDLKEKRRRFHAQFTTIVGDNPSRPIPTAQDNLWSGFRSLRRTGSVKSSKSRSNLPLSPSRESFLSIATRTDKGDSKPAVKRMVSYAWVSVTADVDFEGEDIRDSLGAVVGMVEEGWIRPWIGDSAEKVVPFEKSPSVFRRNAAGPVGLMKDGGTCSVKIVG